jgi:hypothetical protein
VGISADLDDLTSTELDRKTKVQHAAYSYEISFPFTQWDPARLKSWAEPLHGKGRILILTLQPWDGLETITVEDCRKLANLCNESDVPMLIRFGHEMNGNWYPWGQKPSLYKEKFRMVANAIHTHAPKAAMLWSPRFGYGYPFDGGKFACKPGDPDFQALDTDANQALNEADQPYAPYYPGDDAVDWVGMTIMFFGYEETLGQNEIPPRRFIEKMLRGRKFDIPDFYREYCVKRGKPLAISETAALFRPDCTDGKSELKIKESWIHQLYNPAMLRNLGKLKMIVWFDHLKHEELIHSDVDWRMSANPQVAQCYREAISGGPRGTHKPFFLQAQQAQQFLP